MCAAPCALSPSLCRRSFLWQLCPFCGASLGERLCLTWAMTPSVSTLVKQTPTCSCEDPVGQCLLYATQPLVCILLSATLPAVSKATATSPRCMLQHDTLAARSTDVFYCPACPPCCGCVTALALPLAIPLNTAMASLVIHQSWAVLCLGWGRPPWPTWRQQYP